MDIKQKQNEIAGLLTSAMINQYKTASIAFPDPGARLTLAMGVAMIGVSATCQLVIEDGLKEVPDRDELLFACLLISNSAEFVSNDTLTDALAVEFNFENIVKTIDQFHDITGRSIEEHLNKSLVEEVNRTRAKAMDAFVDDLNQFKPQ